MRAETSDLLGSGQLTVDVDFFVCAFQRSTWSIWKFETWKWEEASQWVTAFNLAAAVTEGKNTKSRQICCDKLWGDLEDLGIADSIEQVRCPGVVRSGSK